MVKIKSKVYLVIPLIILVVVFVPLFSSCKNLNGPGNYENVHWESTDGPELSFNFINHEDSFGTLICNNETIEIYFGWFDYEMAFGVYSTNFTGRITDPDNIPWTTYFCGSFKDFDRNNLTITLEIKTDYIFDNEYTEIHLRGTRITE